VHVRVQPHERFTRDGVDLHCDLPLSFAQAALGTHIEFSTLDGVEDLGSVAVEPEDEAAVDGDPVGLDPADVIPVVVESRPLPVPALLDTIDAGQAGALEPDEELPAARLAHQVQQLRVVGDRDVTFAEPVDALRCQRPEQLPGVATIGEAVVVRELDELS
jgi:hypothetical protein